MDGYCQMYSSLQYCIQDCIIVKAEGISLASFLALTEVQLICNNFKRYLLIALLLHMCLMVRTNCKSYSLVNGSQIYHCPSSKEETLPLRDDPGFMVPWE